MKTNTIIEAFFPFKNWKTETSPFLELKSAQKMYNIPIHTTPVQYTNSDHASTIYQFTPRPYNIPIHSTPVYTKTLQEVVLDFNMLWNIYNLVRNRADDSSPRTSPRPPSTGTPVYILIVQCTCIKRTRITLLKINQMYITCRFLTNVKSIRIDLI